MSSHCYTDLEDRIDKHSIKLTLYEPSLLDWPWRLDWLDWQTFNKVDITFNKVYIKFISFNKVYITSALTVALALKIRLTNIWWSYMSLHCCTDLEDSEQIFLHGSSAENNASPYKLCLQKVQQFRKCCHNECPWTFWLFAVKTQQPMVMDHHTMFGCKKISSSDATV